jgi:hypothetical protein
MTSSLHPPAHAGTSHADFSTLKLEAIRSSETSVQTRSTRRHIPEDGIHHSHRCENLKSYTTLPLPLFEGLITIDPSVKEEEPCSRGPSRLC